MVDFLLGEPGWSRAHLGSERPHLCPADQDGDKQLSLPEFISLPAGTVENQQGQDIDDSWVRDRKKEFEELIDANHDGIVTMAELEVRAGDGGRGRTPGVGHRALSRCSGKEAAPVQLGQVTQWHLEVGGAGV